MDKPYVVVIEADQGYRHQLSAYLRANGCFVSEIDDFDTLRDRLCTPEGAIFLVNLASARARGFDLLASAEMTQKCSVLVLSDGGDEIDRVLCLELGADDYIEKSMGQREILARIRAANRRLRTDMPDAGQTGMDAAWRFVPGRRELSAPDGNAVPLTTAEFNLLHVLAQNAGTPLGREYLSRAVFCRAYKAMDRSIDNLVARLRRKLREPNRAPRMIKTARPFGYVFTGFASAPSRSERGIGMPAGLQAAEGTAHADMRGERGGMGLMSLNM